MKIAVLASNFIRIPPRPQDVPMGYSGAPEQVVFRIAEGLVKKGHKVTLFASGDSKTSASLVSVTPRATSKDKNIGVGPHEAYEYLLISKAYQTARKHEFDLVHSHFDKKTAYFAPLVSTPTVSTLHSPLEGIYDILKEYGKSQFFVSISDSQRIAAPELNYIRTVYHGIDIMDYPFENSPGEYMLFVGRFVPEKGAHVAVKISQHMQKKLILLGWAAKLRLKYYLEKIKPFVDHRQIESHGYLTRKGLKEYIRKAKLLLFPISWEEPFGLVMIEAMACGTPVVAYARGSVPEVVVDGVTGFVVEPEVGSLSDLSYLSNLKIKKKGLAGLVEAVEKIYSMPREEYKKMRFACRKHVEDNFTVEKMVTGYEEVYKKVLSSKFEYRNPKQS